MIKDTTATMTVTYLECVSSILVHDAGSAKFRGQAGHLWLGFPAQLGEATSKIISSPRRVTRYSGRINNTQDHRGSRKHVETLAVASKDV